MDSQQLRNAGRDVKAPFYLQIKSENQCSELVCTAISRVLPEKRLVCLGEWNNQAVVVKLFLDPKNAGRHCAREERGVKALREAGIKTPVLLFKGMLLPDKTPVLIFQRIMPAQNLDEVWEKVTNENQRVKLLEQAVGVIADQHNAGIKQDDIHLGNFLIKDGDIYAIDGDAVDAHLMGRPLPQGKSLKNIGRFFAQFHPIYDALVSGVFKKYTENRAWQEQRGLINALIKEIRSNRNVRKKDYLKKIYRECTAFVCRKNWHRFVVCDRRVYSEAVIDFLTDPDSVLDSGRLLKDGNSATVSLIELDGRCFVVKRYNIKSFWHGLKRCLRPSRAWISWRNAHRLSFILGIPTPRPIMLIQNRWGPFQSKAYLVTEHIEGMDMDALFHSDGAEDVPGERIMEQTRDLFQSLADASLSHGDFKATNFIFSGGTLFIIDLDAMHEHRFRWRFRRTFNRDLKRFMQNWTDLPILHKLSLDQINKLKL